MQRTFWVYELYATAVRSALLDRLNKLLKPVAVVAPPAVVALPLPDDGGSGTGQDDAAALASGVGRRGAEAANDALMSTTDTSVSS